MYLVIRSYGLAEIHGLVAADSERDLRANGSAIEDAVAEYAPLRHIAMPEHTPAPAARDADGGHRNRGAEVLAVEVHVHCRDVLGS